MLTVSNFSFWDVFTPTPPPKPQFSHEINKIKSSALSSHNFSSPDSSHTNPRSDEPRATTPGEECGRRGPRRPVHNALAKHLLRLGQGVPGAWAVRLVAFKVDVCWDVSELAVGQGPQAHTQLEGVKGN